MKDNQYHCKMVLVDVGLGYLWLRSMKFWYLVGCHVVEALVTNTAEAIIHLLSDPQYHSM